MKGYWNIILGVCSAILGGILWWSQEREEKLFSFYIALSIGFILLGAFNILYGIDSYTRVFQKAVIVKPKVDHVTFWHWLFIIGLIFIGSVSYTIAAYYHLKLKHWSFLIAFAIALPLVLIEYQFSLRGNFAAKDILKLNALQITLLTMTFYFINSWLLNFFLLKDPIVWWREILAFACIIIAFVLSTRSNV